MARAAAHASDAYRSQSLQLHAAYQVSQDQPSPVETHYANGFSNYMRALQQVSSNLSTKGGDAGTHPENKAQAMEGTSPSPASDLKRQEQVPVAATPPKVKAELVETICDHKELQSPNLKPDTTAQDHHGTKQTPSIRSSSQSGRGKHKKQKHKRPQVPRRFVPEPPKTYLDGKLITPTNNFGPSDLSDSGSSTHRRRRKSRPHRRRSHRKHGHRGGSGSSGSGSSDVGSSSSSSSSLSNQSWDYDDFFDKDAGIWKPPKDHPAWRNVKSHTRKIQSVKRPKRVTLTKWDGNPITFPDKISEVRNTLTDVGLGYLVDKTFLKYWTTYGNKNLLIQARVQQWPITSWSQFSVDLEVFHGMLHQAFAYETTTKYLFSEDVAKHGVKTYLALQDLHAISYDLRRDYFLDMARELYDPKGALSFTDFLKNKLHAHAELSHLGREFSEEEKISMLIQSIVNHRQHLPLMVKIELERGKGADFPFRSRIF
jgi:hypothetical protein